METVTDIIVIPHALGRETALHRLQEAERAAQATDFWPKPEALDVTWSDHGGEMRGKALGFPVDGTVAVGDEDVSITIHVPWTAKALLANFRPALETQLTRLLA